MATLVKNLQLGEDLDEIFVNEDAIDILRDVNQSMVEAEELVQQLSDSNTNVPSSKLMKSIFDDIIRRIKNIEVVVEPLWREVTLKVNNLDSIDQTECTTFHLNTKEANT